MHFEQEFFYRTQPRLQLIFDSPNHCATILVMLALIVIGWATWAWRKGASCRYFLLPLQAIGSVIILYGLLQTYSRGGWISLFVGWFVFLLSAKRDRLVPSTALGIFFLLLILLPHGTDRAGSIVDVEEDHSISHRILVWKGAMALMVEHWPSGVGFNNFGRQFTAWYQPLEMKTRYLGALNNYLTIGAERGAVVLWGYLTIVLVPLILTWWIAHKKESYIILGIVSAQCAYLVSAIFTASLDFWHVTGLYALLYLISFVYTCVVLSKEMPIRSQIKKRLGYYFAIPVMLTLLLVGGGIFFLKQMPTRINAISLQTRGTNLHGIVIYPQQQESKGMLIYFQDKGETVEDNAKIPLRALAEMGYEVVSLDYQAGGLAGLEKSKIIKKQIIENFHPKHLYLAGNGVGGRMAMLVASDSSSNKGITAVASFGASVEWPFSQLSPIAHVQDLSAPLLFLHGTKDSSVSIDEVKKLEETCHKFGKTAEFENFENVGSYPGDDWRVILESMNHFFRQYP